MAYEAAMSKTERTFSEAEIVCDNTKVEIRILILSKEISEDIEFSVEAVIESDLVNAPVAPVLNVLDSGGVSIEAKGNENVLEFALYILDKYG